MKSNLVKTNFSVIVKATPSMSRIKFYKNILYDLTQSNWHKTHNLNLVFFSLAKLNKELIKFNRLCIRTKLNTKKIYIVRVQIDRVEQKKRVHIDRLCFLSIGTWFQWNDHTTFCGVAICFMRESCMTIFNIHFLTDENHT